MRATVQPDRPSNRITKKPLDVDHRSFRFAVRPQYGGERIRAFQGLLVLLTENAAGALEDLALDNLSFVVAALLVVRHDQELHLVQSAGVLIPENVTHRLQSVLPEGLGFVVAALPLDRGG